MSLISPSIAYLFFLSDSDHLLVSVSASYWCSLPGSRRSLATATSVGIGFGMKSLMFFFVSDSLFSGVISVGDVLGLVFCLPYFLIEFLRGRILNPKQQARESLKKHLDVFEALLLDLKC